MLVRVLIFSAMTLILIASQLFWLRRVRELGERLISNPRWRRCLGVAGAITYLFLFAYNFAWVERGASPTTLTLKSALLEAPFWCWVVCSLLGFALAILLWLADRMVRGVLWSYRKLAAAAVAARERGRQDLYPAAQPAANVADPVLPDPPSPDRRRFLEQTAFALSAAPFVAGAYGLFYGRLNLETTHQHVKLARLPKAFGGFRIAQLSDIHIGPFMSEEEIRRYVAITNALKPDLVALTGDFITWDPSTQGAVVKALAGLKAPFGVFGCLGNHEMWTHTEGSLTRLFAGAGIRILRGERNPLQSQGETLNLIGVDFQSRSPMGPSGQRLVRQYLEGVEHLVMPDTANILLSHNPNTFDRAAELGIDLSLAGHTHGGQITLEFISPNLSPSRLITPYVKGWFQKGGSQLYVNRGIGTIFVPMRLGAPPEIALFELTRS